eukprot:6012340-Prymnesium_polylepis.1
MPAAAPAGSCAPLAAARAKRCGRRAPTVQSPHAAQRGRRRGGRRSAVGTRSPCRLPRRTAATRANWRASRRGAGAPSAARATQRRGAAAPSVKAAGASGRPALLPPPRDARRHRAPASRAVGAARATD